MATQIVHAPSVLQKLLYPMQESTELTSQEFRLVEFIWLGMTNKEIAFCLGTTKHAIKNYLRRIYDKRGFFNRVELAMWYEKEYSDKLMK